MAGRSRRRQAGQAPPHQPAACCMEAVLDEADWLAHVGDADPDAAMEALGLDPAAQRANWARWDAEMGGLTDDEYVSRLTAEAAQARLRVVTSVLRPGEERRGARPPASG